MKYRILGATGQQVSYLSLGGSSLGGVFGAFKLGINYVDVAPFYGHAEEVLGKALIQAPFSRKDLFIATKVGRYGDNEFDFSAERVTKSVDESLKKLGLEYIDLIQCHDIEYVNLDVILKETLPALKKLKDAGKVRYIGISGFPLKIFETVLTKDTQHIVDTILSYGHYNLQNTTLEGLLSQLKRRVGVINAAPLLMGLLTTNPKLPPWHPSTPEIRDICAKAAAHCKMKSVPIEKLALQFSLANEQIDSTLCGTASVDELEKNISWVDDFENNGIDQSLLKEVADILQPIKNKSWQTGLPENN